ncbi:MAG: isoamylase early set domain-containing protein [Nitrospirota bacterium]|nr:isoamylase early set domain-containing protein [Nitrospirota bacterium]MDP3598519.1 isoamylase early set domain-containing protein [Nitrospirota bacterium]
MKQPARKKVESPRSPRRPSTKQLVSFEYFDPSATVVTLVGDFNRWDMKVRPLKRDAGGLWKVRVQLEPGTYQYKFVVDGVRWEEDPLNLHRAYNEHGTFNSIRKVAQPPVKTGDRGAGTAKGDHGHNNAG